MSGIYIHIPFCAKKCSYCDFYTQVAPGLINQVVDCIVKEIEVRKDYLSDKLIHTIYFGGGTPSLLHREQFEKIFSSIYQNFNVDENSEITFEANPDDLTDEYFREISPLPFNRISLGIQSFFDDELQTIRRRHTANQALKAVKRAQSNGFSNISIDLIYGLPGQTMEKWKFNIDTALSLGVPHISAYGLTFEEGTALFNQRKKGLVKEQPDELMLEMYEIMVERFENEAYNRYEISNFAKEGYTSRHNSSYWNGTHYLGLGPSAHSFNGKSRQWNVSSNRKYIEAIENNLSFFEIEILTENDKYNDFIMVNLRKAEGVNLNYLKLNFEEKYSTYFLNEIQKYIQKGLMIKNGDFVTLSKQGIHITNSVLEDLFFV